MLINKISTGIRGILRSFHIMNLISIFILIFASSLWGQTYEISGTVLDETGKKLGSARLTLYNSKHHRVKKENTKGNGKFKFKKIKLPKFSFKKKRINRIKKKASEITKSNFQKAINFILTPIFRVYDNYFENKKIKQLEKIEREQKEKTRVRRTKKAD